MHSSQRHVHFLVTEKQNLWMELCQKGYAINISNNLAMEEFISTESKEKSLAKLQHFNIRSYPPFFSCKCVRLQLTVSSWYGKIFFFIGPNTLSLKERKLTSWIWTGQYEKEKKSIAINLFISVDIDVYHNLKQSIIWIWYEF